MSVAHCDDITLNVITNEQLKRQHYFLVPLVETPSSLTAALASSSFSVFFFSSSFCSFMVCLSQGVSTPVIDLAEVQFRDKHTHTRTIIMSFSSFCT